MERVPNSTLGCCRGSSELKIKSIKKVSKPANNKKIFTAFSQVTTPSIIFS
jgi:hypothetical protein